MAEEEPEQRSNEPQNSPQIAGPTVAVPEAPDQHGNPVSIRNSNSSCSASEVILQGHNSATFRIQLNSANQEGSAPVNTPPTANNSAHTLVSPTIGDSDNAINDATATPTNTIRFQVHSAPQHRHSEATAPEGESSSNEGNINHNSSTGHADIVSIGEGPFVQVPIPPVSPRDDVSPEARHRAHMATVGVNGAEPNNSNHHRHIYIHRGRPMRRPIGNMMNGHGPHPRAVLHLPQLQSQTLPLTKQPTSSSFSSEEDSCSDRFKCPICFEVIEDPASCSKCPNRFCYKCIVQVGRQQNAKCPCCRVEFHLSGITRDPELQRKIQLAATISCRYCDLTGLQLQDVKAHEVICPDVQMRCRYSTFGCAWTGSRKALLFHEQNDCALQKVQGLVEQYRQTTASQHHMISSLQPMVMASNQMIEIHRRTLVRIQSKSPGNMLDILELVYLTTCIPARFFSCRDAWRAVHSSPEGRATIYNFLTLLPTAVLCIRVAANAFYQFLSLEHLADDKDTTDEVITMLLAYACALLGFLAISCFFVDAQSSITWNRHIRVHEVFGQTRTILRDLVAISLLAVYFASIELYGSGRNAMVILGLVLFASTLFPALVVTVVGRLDQSFTATYQESPQTILEVGRAAPVVIFGLKYGFVVALLGWSPCAEAIIAIRVFGRTPFVSKGLEALDCFLLDVRSEVWIAIGIARAGILLASLEIEHEVVLILALRLAHDLAAVAAVIIMDYVLFKLLVLGVGIGKAIAETGLTVLAPSGDVPPGQEHCQMGILTFGVWFLILGAISISS